MCNLIDWSLTPTLAVFELYRCIVYNLKLIVISSIVVDRGFELN